MNPIWNDEYKIHSYEVNMNAELTIPSLCQFMQESAWNHAENLGVGFSHLLKKNLVWVVSKMKIKILNIPKWGDTIILNTWPTGYDKLFCYREFQITDNKKNALVEATTTWFAIDLTSRRPQRTETYFSDEIPKGKILFPNRTPKVTEIRNDCKSFDNVVRFKDIDVNGHLNNVKYVEWALDGFTSEERKSMSLYDIEINFLNEAVVDDIVTINKHKVDENSFLHNLVRNSDGKELCRIKTIWK